MNIVQIHSGLGNQMFQYALYLALRHRTPETKIDVSVFAHRPSHNGYELERVFGVRPNYASVAERNRMADVGKEWYAQVRRALFGARHTEGQLIHEPDPANGWAPDILQAKNAYLQGYWQSEHYFEEVTDEVKSAFTFRQPLPEEAQQLANTITAAPNSVSVHIRRGDYLKARRIDDYTVCNESYYRRAVAYMQAHVTNARFYVFSDEPTWGREQQLFPADTVFVSGHNGEQAYIDMQLMSLCRHHIIANSSFSWWGAWLGQEQETITVAPNRWFRHRPRPDIVPTRWIQIDAD